MVYIPTIGEEDYDYADMGLLNIGDLGWSFKRPKVTLPKIPKVVTQATNATAKAAAAVKEEIATSPLTAPQRKLLELKQAQFKKEFEFAKTVANATVTKAKSAAEMVAKATSAGTEKVKAAMNIAGNVIKDIKEKGLAQVTKDAMSKLGDTISKKAKQVLDAAKNAPGALKKKLSDQYNNLKNQAQNAYNAAKNAVAKVAELGRKVASGISDVKNRLASGLSKLSGKMADMAKNIGAKIANVANTVAAKVRESANLINSKIQSAVTNLKGDINAVKSAVLGEMTQMKAQLSNLINAGFNKLRGEMAQLNQAMTAKIAGLQKYVGDVIAQQGKKLADMAAQARENFLELRTGQKDIIASTKNIVEAKTDDIINQFNEQFSHARNRFNHLDTSLARANQERNILRNDLVFRTNKIISSQERDSIILRARIRGTEEKLAKKVNTVTDFTKAGIGVSIAGVVLLAILL
jgi:hypothetical protein